MRLRNHLRCRAPTRSRAATRCKSTVTHALNETEPCAVEALESVENSNQEHERRRRTTTGEGFVKRLRTSRRLQRHQVMYDEDPNDLLSDTSSVTSDQALKKRPRTSLLSGTKPLATSYYCLLQTAVTQEDRIDETSWLTGTLIDLMLWRLATQYSDVHFLATDFCHLHLPSITRKVPQGVKLVPSEMYEIRDVLGRTVDYTSTRPIVFVANVSHIHWNLLRVQFLPHAELQLFEPMGRLSSRSGISYRSVPRCVIEWLDTCYPQEKSWIAHGVSAITRPQQVSGFDCGVACLLYADKCGQGQPRETINESTDQQEITTFRTELQRQLENELLHGPRCVDEG